MDLSKRIVVHLPLDELWDDRGTVVSERLSPLASHEIVDLLGRGPVHFVVADVGQKPHWVPLTDQFDFWKNEVRPHLLESPARFDALRDAYGYFAWEWSPTDGTPIVVLERHH